jgi:hypothetical protein
MKVGKGNLFGKRVNKTEVRAPFSMTLSKLLERKRTFFAAPESLDMICFLGFAMRLGHRAHKLPLVRSHDTSGSQVIVQDLPDKSLSSLASIIPNLLPRSIESSLGWAIGYRKDHTFKCGNILRWRRNSVGIFRDDTKVELLLRLLGHREAQGMA